MRFSEVIGQEEVKQRLMQMVKEDRLPHAIMLCGPQGIGKKALATAFACYLLERGERKEERGESDAENPMLKKLEHPDLHFTYPTIKLPSMGAILNGKKINLVLFLIELWRVLASKKSGNEHDYADNQNSN